MPPPRSFLTDSGTWPQGPFRDDAPPIVYLAARLAEDLQAHIDKTGITSLERCSGVLRQTIYNIARGNTWAQSSNLARLEVAMDKVIWNHEHIHKARQQREEKKQQERQRRKQAKQY